MAPKAKKESRSSSKKEKQEKPAGKEEGVDKDVKGKSKQEDKEEKRRAELARKAENARLLAEEEAAVSAKPKQAPKKKGAKDNKPAGPGAIAAGGDLSPEPEVDRSAEVESYAATGIDNALDLLEVVTAKMDKASVGQQAATIERHPERRFKAAFEAYLERELPNIKNEQPGLRSQQYRDLLYKQFQKSPENPFNQTTVAYDANKEEKVQALQSKKAEVEERLREKS